MLKLQMHARKICQYVYDRQCCETFLCLFQLRIKFSQIKQNEMRLENKIRRETMNID